MWWFRSGSTLAHIIVCCLMAPSPYLKQYQSMVECALWHWPESNFTRIAHELNKQPVFRDCTFKITSTSLRGQLLKYNGLSTRAYLLGHTASPTKSSQKTPQTLISYVRLNTRIPITLVAIIIHFCLMRVSEKHWKDFFLERIPYACIHINDYSCTDQMKPSNGVCIAA